jgi:predicted amidohydrolase YtcJ
MTESPIKIFFLLVLGTAFFTFLFVYYMPQRADTLYVNGRFYTMDDQNTIADAIAVSGDHIAGVGSQEYIRRKFKAKYIVDLQAKTVLPGFIDAHCHLLGMGLARMTVDLDEAGSEEAAAAVVGRKAGALHIGQWIRGRGWDENSWPKKSLPTHASLDVLTSGNPVFLMRIDGHACWLNQKALALANITPTTDDPPGGRIIRDKKGSPTGVLVDAAMDLVYKFIPEPSDDEMRQAVRAATKECNSFGLTSVQEMELNLRQFNLYQKLIDEDIFPLRVYSCIDGPGETWDYFKQHRIILEYGNKRLTVRGFKLYVDGALGSRGAALVEPYSDDAANRGITLLSAEELKQLVQEAVDRGYQVCTHAIGDRANHMILDVYENITLQHPLADLRLRVEHAEVLSEEDIPRFKKLGVLPSMQPVQCISDMFWAEARLGSKRIRNAFVWRSLLKTGVMIPGGSDFPVESANPLYGIYSACARQDLHGLPRNAQDVRNNFQLSQEGILDTAAFENGWYGSERMTREEAVKSFTRWAAYASFEEDMKGALRSGMLADFVVLSADIMTIPVQEIPNTKVVTTVLGGKIVYQSGL